MRNIILYKLRRTSHYITGDDISLMDIIDIVIRHHEIRCCIRIVPRLEFLYIIVAWHRFILHSEASRADAFKHKLAFAMRVSVIARAPPIATNIIQTQTNFIVPESFAQCYSPLSHTHRHKRNAKSSETNIKWNAQTKRKSSNCLKQFGKQHKNHLAVHCNYCCCCCCRSCRYCYPFCGYCKRNLK